MLENPNGPVQGHTFNTGFIWLFYTIILYFTSNMYKVEIAMIVITYPVLYRNDIINFALCHQMSTLLQNDIHVIDLCIFCIWNNYKKNNKIIVSLKKLVLLYSFKPHSFVEMVWCNIVPYVRSTILPLSSIFYLV